MELQTCSPGNPAPLLPEDRPTSCLLSTCVCQARAYGYCTESCRTGAWRGGPVQLSEAPIPILSHP